MRIFLPVLLFFILLSCTLFKNTEKQMPELAKVEIETRAEATDFGPFVFNPYPVIHHVYMGVFYYFNIYESLSVKDKVLIFYFVYGNLNKGNNVALSFRNLKEAGILTILLKFLKNTETKKTDLLLMSNYDLNKRQYIDISKEDIGNVYAKLFYIYGGLLVKSSSLYSGVREAELIKEGNASGLADFYMFDEKPENDGETEKLLTAAAGDALHPEQKKVYLTTLVQYYLYADDYQKALETYKTVLSLEEKSPTNNDALKKAIRIAGEEMEIYKFISDRFIGK